MHYFDESEPKAAPNRAVRVWFASVALLVVPALLVWVVRASALAMSCDPTPDVCHGVPLGGGLRDALNLSWFVGLNSLLCVGVSLVAALAAIAARKPLLGALSMLLLPVVTLGLPAFAIYTVTSADCMPNEAAVGDCVLWGARLGMAAHSAVLAENAIFDLVPYTFALALMIGVIGYAFFRPKHA